MTDVNATVGTVVDGGGTEPFVNPANVNDVNGATYARRGAFAGSGGVSQLTTDLGVPYTVTSMYLSAWTEGDAHHVAWDVYRSNTGANGTWVPVPVMSVHTDSPGTSTLTLVSPTASRFWQILTPDPFPVGIHFQDAVRVFTWEINGTLEAFDPLESPPYEAPTPGAAVVEIYAAEAGAYRWGTAIWGDPSVWSAAGWRNVTPEAVDVEILWGSQRPELGILSKPEAASWGIDFYDPSRMLDPSNREGPYYGDLQPGLPVRVRHGERVIRQGIAESIGYQFSESFGDEDRAYFRVTDVISVLANARVPTDSTLADTLSARARDAIAAAGLTVTVLPDRADGDPVLAPWVTGQDFSAWEWIVDAAESVLHVPIITNVGHLGFRAWAEPLDRARRLASPNLVGLQSIIAHNGLYSVVTALQSPGDGGAVMTRELTPKPRYGARQYDRDAVTPNAGDWAMAVLTDRAQAGLRWVPGEVYPLTADDVNLFGSIEQLERVGLYYPEADPAVVQDVVIVGGRIGITAKKDSEAIWSFEFQAAQTAQSPLIDDDTGTTFLVRDDDPTEFLYPDG